MDDTTAGRLDLRRGQFITSVQVADIKKIGAEAIGLQTSTSFLVFSVSSLFWWSCVPAEGPPCLRQNFKAEVNLQKKSV